MHLLPLLLLISQAHPEYNYDESKVAAYTLPDPLTLQNGKHVNDAATWKNQRRPELLRLFEDQVYGRTPRKRLAPSVELLAPDGPAFEGKATRRQVRIFFAENKSGPKLDLLIYVPTAAKKPAPAFLGPNFSGNHTVASDPGIHLGDVWTRGHSAPATEQSRGTNASQWQVEKILERGYALATFYYGDIEPDFDGGIQYGIRPLFYRPGQTAPAADEWGAIGAWAWGLSRALDYLDDDRDIDAHRVAVMGHSRLGKTALWAGAQDQRFAVVISNCSGAGGASLFRRNFGETVEHLNTAFPHWFAGNFHQYSDRPGKVPVDEHELLALIAPRPLYIATADQDLGADPHGEFLSANAAAPVYELLGKQGLGTTTMPGIHQPIVHTIAFHERAGKHDVTAYDWDQYLAFADLQFRNAKQ
jgi:hypothetical protein